jgi:uncharacterized lipoprotein YddW (UPF0748 family)
MNLFRRLTLGLLPMLLPAAIHASPPEVRGTWLTTTANDAISTPQKTGETMKRLRDIGLNVVYIECWKNGYTEYPSATMKQLVGVDMRINGKDAVQRNLLQEGVIEAHRNQMLAIAWLEYGFMAAFKDTNPELRKVARERGWLTVDKDGNEVGKKNPFVWMNPLHPGPQQLMIDLTLEAIRDHDLDGIQLDDRIALPTDMGYDPYTLELYAKEHNGAKPPTDPKDPAFAAWTQWRADKISEYSLRYVRAIRAAHPDIIISVSPAPWPWSLENYACDWTKWVKWCHCGGNKWTEYVPQVYRMSGEATIKSIDEQIEHMGVEKLNMIAGIRIVGDGPDMPWEGLKASIEHGRNQNIAGHCLWFSRGVLDIYPEQLKAFYDVANKGHAAHPFKPGDWRPAPIVATKTEGGSWRAKVDLKGRYRVIAKKNGAWHETISMNFAEGTHTIVEDADAVELLVDRRP